MNHCMKCEISVENDIYVKKDCLKCEKGIATLQKKPDGTSRCFNCKGGFTPQMKDGKQIGCECVGDQVYTYHYISRA